jgi:ferredoxin-NADP reductase
MTDHLKHMMRHTSGKSSTPKDIVSYEVALKETRQIAIDTFAFVFEKPSGFQFRAGQHARVTLIFPAETDDKGNSRFLSFASSPDDPDLMWAMRMTDTAFKRSLKNMRAGDKVLMQMRLNPPQEAFGSHQPKDIPKRRYFSSVESASRPRSRW